MISLLSKSIAFTIIIATCSFNLNAKNIKRKFTDAEKSFIKNVVRNERAFSYRIKKQKNESIIIKFKNIKYTLLKDGFIGEIWVKENNKWQSLGLNY